MIQIGFMQGRLSPQIDGRIQAFPWQYWQDEFAAAQQLGFEVMEWTLDHERLFENPLMTRAGRRKIKELSDLYQIRVPSVTADCFMQAPFFKAGIDQQATLVDELRRVLEAARDLGIEIVVFPLVDNGSITDRSLEAVLHEGLAKVLPLLLDSGLRIAFESDFPPQDLARFIADFDSRAFGINYDTGNSAALGYHVNDEIQAYGDRIVNVHIKDRLRGGTTVPLGSGNADLPAALSVLRCSGYHGNLILQTARAANGDHAGVLANYRSLVAGWWQDLAVGA